MIKKLIIFCLIIILAPFCLLLLLQDHVVQYTKNQIEKQTGYHVKLHEVSLAFPLDITIEELVLSDEDRILLHADQIHFSISLMHLFKGEISVKNMHILNLLIDLNAMSTPSSSNHPETFKNATTLAMPFYWNISQLDIDNFSMKDSKHLHPYWRHLQFTGHLNLKHHRVFKLNAHLKHVGETALPENLFFQISASPTLLTTTCSLLETSRSNSFLNHLPDTHKIEASLTFSTTWDTFESVLQNPQHHPLASIHGQIAVKTEGRIQSETHSHMHLSPQGILSIDQCTTKWQIASQNVWQNIESNATYDIDSEIIQMHLDTEDFNLDSLALLYDQKMEGIVSAQMELEGILTSPEVHLKAQSQKITLNEKSYEAIEATLTTNGQEGEISLSTRFLGNDYHFLSPFSWKTNERLQLHKIEFSAPGLRAYGQMQYDLKKATFLGKIKGDMAHFHAIDESLGGSGAFELTLNNEPQNHLVLEGQLKSTSHQKLKIDSIAIKLTMNKIEELFKGNLSIKLNQLALDKHHLDQMEIDSAIDSSMALWPISLTILSSAKENSLSTIEHSRIISSGGWHINTESFDLEIVQLSGDLHQLPIYLDQPSKVHLDANLFSITPLKIHLNRGFLDIELKKEKEQLSGHLTLKHIPMQLVSMLAFSNVRMKGWLDLESRIQGSADDLSADLTATFNKVKIQEELFYGLKPIQGVFKGRLKENKIELLGEFSAFDNHPFNFSTTLPLIIHPSFLRFSIPTNIPMQTHLDAKGEISSLLKLIVTDTTNFSGQTDIQVDMTGTLDEPLIQGKAHLTNGTYESLDTGAVFKNLAFFIEGDGKMLKLKTLTADDALKGKLSVTGELALDAALNFPHIFHLSLDRARLIHQDYASVAGTGELTLKGDMKSALLSGLLNIEQANVVIPEELPAQLHSVDVIFVNDPMNTAVESAKKEENWMSVDLQLAIPETAQIKGRNLESRWKGNVRMSGHINKPLVNGSLEIVKGSYDLHGHLFTSHHGTIHFGGDLMHKSTLYVSAERQIEQNRIELILSGPLSDPKLRFRSNPPMSEKEILSWILFNRGILDITAHEGQQLQQSSITISGGKNDNDLLSQIRNRFGIDRLDINTNESNALDPAGTHAISLRVGKYLSKGIFISINKSINAEVNQIALEANLSRNWRLQAEVGDNAEGKFILKWERDY